MSGRAAALLLLAIVPCLADEGRDLYNRACTMCHGPDGTAGDRAPALGAQRRYLRSIEEDLFDAIKNGIPGTLMPASALPAADVTKIVAYIRALRATAIDAPTEGDPEKGREVFHAKGRCAGCHTVNGRGGLLGPDLSNVANERSVAFLRESLTQSKPHIPAGYQPVRVATKDGRTIRGILRNEHNFSLQVLGDDSKLHLLDREEVASIDYGKESLMPSNYDKILTAAEFRDLLAFLSRQGVSGFEPVRTRRRR